MKSVFSQVTPLLVFSSVLGLTVSALRINVGPFVTITNLERIPRNNDGDGGIVPGIRSCGGSGQVLQWRYETCRFEDNPCHAPADGTLKRAEVDFIPSKSINSLGLRLIVKSFDGEINKELNYARPIFNSAVKKGQAYTISTVGGVTEELKGKQAKFQYILYDKFSNEVEICAESDFKYV